jgi:hypothetical protein
MAALMSSLCHLCKTYDFDELFNASVRDCHEEHLEEDLPQSSLPFGTLSELQHRSEHCGICAFLFEAWTQHTLHSQEVRPDDQLVLSRWRARNGVIGWNDLVGVTLTGVAVGCARLEILNKGYSGVAVAFDPWPPSRYPSAARFRTFSQNALDNSPTDLPLVQKWMQMCCPEKHPRCWVSDEHHTFF